MRNGPYIVARLLPEFVEQACIQSGITCESFSDNWVLRLQKDDIVRWIMGYQFDLNSAAASGVAQDKVATHLLLQAAGIPSVEHILVRSLPDEKLHTADLQSLDANAGLVVKPLDGTGGWGIVWQPNVSAAMTHITNSLEAAWAASPFYDIVQEFRLIVCNGSVLLAYEKTMPVEQAGMKFYNLGLGAIAVDITDNVLLQDLTATALNVCSYVSLRLAAVDIVRTSDSRLKVLEINDGIMMENYARQNLDYKNRAAEAYRIIVQAMFES